MRNNKYIKKAWMFLPALFIMILIFHFSAEGGTESANLSHGFAFDMVAKISNMLKMNLTDERISVISEAIQLPVRKGAHMTEYAILAASICIPLLTMITDRKKIFTISVLISCVYACSDEIHQLYVPGRTGKATDVIIDTVGAIIGVLICIWIYNFILKKRKKGDF